MGCSRNLGDTPERFPKPKGLCLLQLSLTCNVLDDQLGEGDLQLMDYSLASYLVVNEVFLLGGWRDLGQGPSGTLSSAPEWALKVDVLESMTGTTPLLPSSAERGGVPSKN